MRLTKINYRQHRGFSQEWILSDLVLGPSNLVVGKNASGKTRTLAVIHALGLLLSGKLRLQFISGDYDTLFDHENKTLRYCLEYEDRKVVREEFFVEGRKLLSRGPGGIGTIYHEKEQKNLDFQTPETDLAAVARRDSIQHPFLEPLCEWGADVRHYSFGDDFSRKRGSA